MRRKYIDIPDHARVTSSSGEVGLSAALGLRPWKVFEVVQEPIVGAARRRSGLVLGRFNRQLRGRDRWQRQRLAWMTQSGRHADQATKARGVVLHRPARRPAQVASGDGDQPLIAGAWRRPSRRYGKKMIGFIAGRTRSTPARLAVGRQRGHRGAAIAAVAALADGLAHVGAGQQHRQPALRYGGRRSRARGGAEPGGDGGHLQLGGLDGGWASWPTPTTRRSSRSTTRPT